MLNTAKTKAMMLDFCQVYPLPAAHQHQWSCKYLGLQLENKLSLPATMYVVYRIVGRSGLRRLASFSFCPIVKATVHVLLWLSLYYIFTFETVPIFQAWISANTKINSIFARCGWYLRSLLILLCGVLQKMHQVVLLQQNNTTWCIFCVFSWL